jgi:hypothetical protein
MLAARKLRARDLRTRPQLMREQTLRVREQTLRVRQQTLRMREQAATSGPLAPPTRSYRHTLSDASFAYLDRRALHALQQPPPPGPPERDPPPPLRP